MSLFSHSSSPGLNNIAKTTTEKENMWADKGVQRWTYALNPKRVNACFFQAPREQFHAMANCPKLSPDMPPSPNPNKNN